MNTALLRLKRCWNRCNVSRYQWHFVTRPFKQPQICRQMNFKKKQRWLSVVGFLIEKSSTNLFLLRTGYNLNGNNYVTSRSNKFSKNQIYYFIRYQRPILPVLLLPYGVFGTIYSQKRRFANRYIIPKTWLIRENRRLPRPEIACNCATVALNLR